MKKEKCSAGLDAISAIETERGDIARSERSALAPEAQPYQDFIERLFYVSDGNAEAACGTV